MVRSFLYEIRPSSSEDESDFSKLFLFVKKEGK